MGRHDCANSMCARTARRSHRPKLVHYVHGILTCSGPLLFTQTYEEIVGILRSLTRIKGVRLRIKAEYWSEEYAAESEQPKYTGTIDRWANATEKVALYVQWEGYTRNQLAPLDKMENDASGESLELELLPYADGRPEPTLQAARPTPSGTQNSTSPPQNAGTNGTTAIVTHDFHDGGDDGGNSDVVDVHGQQWTERAPTYINEDMRTQPRMKPVLNKGDADLSDLTSLFLFFLPPAWITDILKYTNPYLDDRDAIHAKLTEGELLRFFASNIVSLHGWEWDAKRSLSLKGT